MDLSICIIAKNEELNIKRCLDSLIPYGFQIVVVDTGSTDHTKEIALHYTDDVYHFDWNNNFSEARNFAISKCINTYVMSMDCDECIEYIDVEKLENMLEEKNGQVGRIKIKNLLTHNGEEQVNIDWINRIFSKKLFHYEGRIHEQVTAIDGHAYEVYQAPVVILHTGYNLPEKERKQKADRNIGLLHEELQHLLITFLQKENQESYITNYSAMKDLQSNKKQCVEQINSIIDMENDLSIKL